MIDRRPKAAPPPDDALSPWMLGVCLSAAAAGWVVVELIAGVWR